MSAVELVVFDMAGTTIEDGGQVRDAFLTATREHRLTMTGEELQAWRGASKLEVLGHFVQRQFGPDDPGNSARVEAAYASLREQLLQSDNTRGVRAMPGAEAAFAWLWGRGIKVALTTGFYRQVTDIILEGAGWRQGASTPASAATRCHRGGQHHS